MNALQQKLSRASREALSEDDLFVLRVIFNARLRTWLVVFSVLFAFIAYLAYPYLFYSHDSYQIAGSIAGICVFVLFPAAIFFWKKVWVYRQDLKADFKYVVQEQIVRKQYFVYTDQYFLSLSDPDYLHHEVTKEDFEKWEVGDHYPVCFAAHSHYPFTLRSRITMM